MSEVVLVTENEPSLRFLIRRFLHMEGYGVLEASNADDAIRLCEYHPGPINLLIAAVTMPEMSGLELGEIASRVRPGIKLLYVSACITDGFTEIGVQDAAFVQKPFSLEQFCQAVRDVLKNRRSQPKMAVSHELG